MRTMYKQKWYRPREVARLGLIQNSTGNGTESGNYNFILEQIKAGRLAARNYSTGSKIKYWLISETAIENYHKSINATAK